MKQNNHEVMEVDVEEILPENELDKVIETTLVKANITEQVLAKLKETYGGMTLKSIDDKESYLEIKKSRLEVRKVGILTERICKKGREDAVIIQRKWINKEKEILEKISEVQDPLDKEMKKFEDEVERKENEEKQRREEVFIARQSLLLKYGAEYKNGCYELNELSYEIELIKQSDDEMFEGVILPKYRKIYEQKEVERVAEEARRKEESDRLKAEQDRFLEEQRKFKEQQDLFLEKQRKLREQQEESDRKESERKIQQQKEIDTLNNIKLNDRISKLTGWSYNGITISDHDKIFGSKEDLLALTDQEFESKVADNILYEETLRKIAEKKRLDEIESEKQKAVQKERERVEEEYRQIELNKQKDAEMKQSELETAKEKVKYQYVINYLSEYPKYEMKSGIYKSKMNFIRDFIADLKEN